MSATIAVLRRACTIVPLSMFLFVACTVQPEVKYLTDLERDLNGFQKFHLAEGQILISKRSTEARESEFVQAPSLEMDNKVASSQVVASVVPKEYTNYLYAIVPQSHWYHFGLVSTIISSTYYDNTRLVNKLGVEVSDNRIKAIEAVGAIALAALVVAMVETNTGGGEIQEPALSLPIVISPGSIKEDTWHPLPLNQAWAYRIRKLDRLHERDAVPSEEFFKHDAKESPTVSTFPVSSCKRILLELSMFKQDKYEAYVRNHGARPDGTLSLAMRAFIAKEWEGDLNKSPFKRAFLLKIPDPTRVRLLQIPPKGEISTHTVCGANTSMQSGSSANAFDLVGALMKQVQAVIEAQKEKDKAE